MKYKISKEKHKELKEELKSLLTEKKDQLNEDWRLAVQEGDDRETDAITVALKLLHEHELRVREIYEILDNCIIIGAKSSTRATLTSKLQIEINGRKQKISLVDPIEANPIKGLISIKTPLGRSLLGKRAGQVTKYKAPNKEIIEVVILKVNV